jgi:predicted RecB family endonuclease
VQQFVEHMPTDELHAAINEALSQLVTEVSNHLNSEQQARYIEQVENFRQEAQQVQPDKSKLTLLLHVLSFGDSLNGTLDVGSKALLLMSVAAPYVGAVAQAVERLLP